MSRTATMINEVSSFLYDCIRNDARCSFSIVEHSDCPTHYFQFFIVGGDGGRANGEIQTDIAGPHHSGDSDPIVSDRFESLRGDGWDLDSGNADRIFGNFESLEQVEAHVAWTAELTANIYNLDTDTEWTVLLTPA